jgi:ferric-dicitrate binding protein FerR (iron transport regulator)
MYTKKLLALLLGGVIAVPGWGASNPVGTVQNSSSASVRGSALVKGTTLYSGDVISTAQQGNAWVSLPGGAQFYLAANSRAQVRKLADDKSVQLEVGQGVAKFRSTESTPIEVVLADATIRPATGGAGYIALLTPTTAIIGAEKGAVLITTEHDGNTTMVPEGSAVNVSMASGAPSGSPQGVKSPVASHAWIVIVGAFVAGGLIGGAIGANLNENSQNPNNVSPFKP